MLFWIDPGNASFLSHTAHVENVCYRSKDIRQVVSKFSMYGSLAFVRHIATELENRIAIHSNFKIGTHFLVHGKRCGATTEYFPLLGEFEDLERYPKRFAIRTDNLDLIRELIARGRELSWYDPDVVKFAHVFPQLKLEHLFVCPYIGRNIITIDGDLKPIKQTKMQFVFPAMKKVGYSVKGLFSNYNLYVFFKSRAKKKKRAMGVGHNLQATYYNILSITYMLCNKSIAMNAERKTAPKD